MSRRVNIFRAAVSCADADVQAFLVATGITDATIVNALCTLVSSAKTNGWWTACNAIYPFVGGTATTHKFNLKNPADTNAAFRLLFTGGVTHNANGVTGNGINASANTFLTQNLLSVNSTHISTYSRTNVLETSIDIGCTGNIVSGSLSGLHHSPRFTGLDAVYRQNLNGTPTAVNTDSRGFYLSTRQGATLSKMFKNGTQIITSALPVSNPTPVADSIKILSMENSVFVTQFYSTRNIAFATIGAAVSDALSAQMYTDIQSFQTALSRNV
jgi:hypothetical protein